MEGDLVDRISLLDGNTLNHILSFTDTKSAVRTSVLSKRWVGLWKDQHNLEFCSSMFPTDLSFFAFVNKVLQDRKASIKIDSIKIVYNGVSASFPAQVSNWLHAASEAEAAEIVISSRQERDCVVPVQVFSNPRLKYLVLDLHCRISIPTPDQLDLPEMRQVKIRNTNFDQPDLGLDLTANSPKLEYLDFGRVQTSGDGLKITVISKSLRDLKVKIRYGVGDLYRPSMMNVHAPAMSSLVCYCLDQLVLQDVSALQSADVAVIKPNVPVAEHNLQFLQQMVGVKDMKISFFPTSQGAASAPPGLVFLNLQNLHLSLCNIVNGITHISSFVRCSPHVQFLRVKLYEQLQDPHLEADDLVIPDFGGMPNLKYVVIENLHGRASEISFIKFLVGNVFALENVHLQYAPAGARVGVGTIHSFHRDLKAIRQQVLAQAPLSFPTEFTFSNI